VSLVRTTLLIIGLVAVAGLLALGVDVLREHRHKGRVAAATGDARPPATPFIWPGVALPAVVPAAAAELADDEPVIGVVVRGKPRAYRVKALASSTGHVVNDLLAGAPVTVTHCDRTGCTRVFGGDGTEALAVMTGGYSGGLLLRVGGRFYHQVDGRPLDDPAGAALPYQAVEFRQVPWKEWRAAHPDTDVYVGEPPVSRSGP
jgi:Protein of unknown function (DUF3179)